MGHEKAARAIGESSDNASIPLPSAPKQALTDIPGTKSYAIRIAAADFAVSFGNKAFRL